MSGPSIDDTRNYWQDNLDELEEVPGPRWAQGYALEDLRKLRHHFDAHDDGLILGAFSKVTDATIADWLSRGRLAHTGECVWAWRRIAKHGTLTDFTGRTVCQIPNGTIRIDRFAGNPTGPIHHHSGALLSRATPLLVRGWVEKDADVLEAAGLHRIATKITAASELVGYWTNTLPADPLPLCDYPGIATLPLRYDPAELQAEVRALGTLPWVEHYSTYNRARTWKALSLRGYGDSRTIEKPAEMSRGWKAEHPDWQRWTLDWTALATRLPLCTSLVRSLARGYDGAIQRVRLMRLDPDGGELTRHADITDPEAGTRNGCFMRVHLPIWTDPRCQFTSWDLGGIPHRTHLTAGTAWYLDTRKPHAARNPASTTRLHLVADIEGAPHLRAHLAKQAGAWQHGEQRARALTPGQQAGWPCAHA